MIRIEHPINRLRRIQMVAAICAVWCMAAQFECLARPPVAHEPDSDASEAQTTRPRPACDFRELERTLNKLPNVTDAERAHLEELTRRIVNKLLHDPITMLRRSESLHGTTSQYLHALERLFHLDPDASAADVDGEDDVEQDD